MGAEWQLMPIGFLSGGEAIRQRKLWSDGMKDRKISEVPEILDAFDDRPCYRY